MKPIGASDVAMRAQRQGEMALSLSLADLRDRYGRGRSQLLKWLVDPYAVCGVYLAFVILIVDRGGEAPGLTVACAVVPFQLFLMTTFNALQLAKDRRSLIQNVSFPRSLLPAAITITETLGFAASLTLLALMMGAYAIAPTPALLWLPAVLTVTFAFAMASAYPAALFGVWFREYAPFARSAVRVFYFLAPGVVALSQVPGAANELVRLNPLTGIFEAYRDVLLYGQGPAAWELAYPLAFSVVLAAIFLPLFEREQRHLAKVV